MVKCSFCNKSIVKGTGKLFIKKTGKMFYFCSNKCEKNMFKLGRKADNLKWTKPKKAKKKETK